MPRPSLDEIFGQQRPPLDQVFAQPTNALQQAQALMAQKQPISTTEDVLKTAASVPERAVAGTVMALPNILNTAVAGPQLLGRAIAEKVDNALGIEPQPRGELWQPFYSSEDVLHMLPEPLQPHTPQTMAGVVTDVLGQTAFSPLVNKGIQKVTEGGREFLGSQNSGNQPKPVKPGEETYTPDQLFTKAGEYYDQADAKNAVIGNPKIQGMVSDIKNALGQSGFDEDFHPDTAKWVSKLEKASVDENGNPVDLPWAKVNGYRKLLNGVINDSMKKGGTEDGYQAMKARDILDKGLDSLQPADLSAGDPAAIELTRQGNTLWSAANKAQDVQRILDNANTMDNPVTGIKTGFRNLSKQVAKNRGGWTDEEIEGIQHAAETGLLTGALKTMGSRLISGLAGGASGIAGGGMLGAPLGVAAGEALAFPMRAAANALQTRRADAVADSISNRPAVRAAMGAPAAQAVLPPAQYPATPIGPIVGSGAAMQALQPAQPQEQPKQRRPLSEILGNLSLPSPISDANASEAPPQDIQSQVQPNDLMSRIAHAESSGNPNAKNPNSSASGLFQFTNGTWASAIAKWGKELGYTLKDKNDPAAQTAVMQKLVEDNAKVLSKATGREPTDADIYAAHVLGAGGAAKLLKSDPNRQALTLFPRKVVDANRSLFFAGRKPRTAAELYQVFNDKVTA